MPKIFNPKLLIPALIVVGFFGFGAISAQGEETTSTDTLKNEITARNSEISQLEKEIKELDGKIESSLGKASTLKSEVANLDNTILQLNKKIKLTETKITTANANIKKLEADILIKIKNISGNKTSLGEMIKIINEKDGGNLLELVLSQETVSQSWNVIENLQELQKNVVAHVNDLEAAKLSLEKNKVQLNKERASLISLKSQLNDQKKIANQAKTEKNQLLAETKNQEINYRKMLAETEARKKAVEMEIADFEGKLKFVLDPSAIPKIGKILLAPLTNVFITQAFGYTKDAKWLYTSGFHNGIDLRASRGTPIRAMASGKVAGVGDTDLTCRGASYGKWVLIRHENGLTTLYAHLSLIPEAIQDGRSVIIGDLIGYSGNTGASTGPHLHLSVYASSGVRIDYLPSNACKGKTFRLPMAAQSAYLNPQNYF